MQVWGLSPWGVVYPCVYAWLVTTGKMVCFYVLQLNKLNVSSSFGSMLFCGLSPDLEWTSLALSGHDSWHSPGYSPWHYTWPQSSALLRQRDIWQEFEMQKRSSRYTFFFIFTLKQLMQGKCVQVLLQFTQGFSSQLTHLVRKQQQ